MSRSEVLSRIAQIIASLAKLKHIWNDRKFSDSRSDFNGNVDISLHVCIMDLKSCSVNRIQSLSNLL